MRMMDPQQIERFKQAQADAVSDTKSRIKQLEKFKDDYKSLDSKLTTLPDKISHCVRVPFGKLAFMPGELVHTNEVTVLLGDNWFVERSATQARGIIERRLGGIDKQIQGLKQQSGLLEPRLDYTNQLAQEAEAKDTVEIKEDYNPVAEKAWQEEHRKNVQKYRKELRREQQVLASQKTPAEKEPMTDDEVWARLAALEMQERQGREMERIGEDEDASKTTFDFKRRKVTWTDQQEQCVSDDSEGDSDGSDGEEATERPNTITFKHTRVEQTEQHSNPTAPASTSQMSMITSPSDIYKYFASPTEPRSILKSPTHQAKPVQDSQPSVKFQDVLEAEQKAAETLKVHREKAAAESAKAFGISVIERQPTQTVISEPVGPQCSNTDSAQPPKKISKFKQRRLEEGKR